MRSREQALGGRAAAGRTERWSASEVGKQRGESLPPQYSPWPGLLALSTKVSPQGKLYTVKTWLSRYSLKMPIFISLPSCCVYLVKVLVHRLWVGFMLRCWEDIAEFWVRHNLIDVRHHCLVRS